MIVTPLLADIWPNSKELKDGGNQTVSMRVSEFERLANCEQVRCTFEYSKKETID